MVNRNDKEDDDDMESVNRMADRLKLKKGSRERARYVHDHMTGLGYRMQPSYVRPDDDDDDDGGGRFRFRSSKRSRDDDDDGGYPF
jgi:hypothetical protein